MEGNMNSGNLGVSVNLPPFGGDEEGERGLSWADRSEVRTRAELHSEAAIRRALYELDATRRRRAEAAGRLRVGYWRKTVRGMVFDTV